MSPLPLFDTVARFDPPDDICARKHGGAVTSEMAHEKVRPRKEALYQLILEHFRARGEAGETTESLSLALGLRYTTASARCSELLHDGRLVRSGRRRPTSTGCAASVLVLTEFGSQHKEETDAQVQTG